MTKSQQDKFNTARFELHQLLAQSALSRVPLLVVCWTFIRNSAMSLRSFINPCGSLATKMTLTVTQRLQNWYKTCEFIHWETYLPVLTLGIGNWTKYQTALSQWVTQDAYWLLSYLDKPFQCYSVRHSFSLHCSFFTDSQCSMKNKHNLFVLHFRMRSATDYNLSDIILQWLVSRSH